MVASKSQARLQKVVAPMANRIESIYHTDLNLDEQLEEVHRMIDQLSVADVQTRSPPIPARNPARSPIIEAPNPLGTTPDDWPLPPNSLRQQNPAISLSEIPQSSTSPEPSSPIGHNFYGHNPASPTRSRQVCQSISPKQKRVSEHSFNGASLRYSSSSYASSTTSSGGWSDNGTLRDSLISRQTSPSTKKTSPLPYTPELREPGDRRSDATLSLLPPPALGLSAPYELERPTSRSTLSPYPQVHSEITKLHRSSTTTSQKAAFEKEAFRNSAILCDV